MNARSRFAFVAVVAALLGLLGCGEQAASDLTIERLPDVNPSLPDVPQLPPPPHEIQYSDQSYSVYGVRRASSRTMDQELAVTGYIVEIYQPPVCEEGRTCDPPSAPHLWIADSREPAADEPRIMLAGYAENQEQIDEAIDLHARHRDPVIDPESGILPVPFDLAVGAKIKARGRFTRMSSAGFNVSNGMLDYRAHEIVEPPPGTEPEEAPEH